MNDQNNPITDTPSIDIELQSTILPQPFVEPSITSEFPQTTEPQPFIETFSQEVPKPFAETTTLPLSNTTTAAYVAILNDLDPMIDPQLYPKSSQIYQELCEKFGSARIGLLPRSMSKERDSERANWYKASPQTNLLYFLHKSDKYKAKMQKILDLGFCANCCCYSPITYKGPFKGINTRGSGPAYCLVCFDESLLVCTGLFFFLYPLFNCSLPFYYNQFFGDFNPPPSDSSYPKACCSFYERSVLRTELFSALKKSGLNTSLPPCPCLTTSFCNSCVAMQYEAIFSFYSWKRYRKPLIHFNGRQFITKFDYSHQPFLEWYDLDKAFQAHNATLQHKMHVDTQNQSTITPTTLTMD